MKAAATAMMIMTITIAPAISKVLEEDELEELDELEEVADEVEDDMLVVLGVDVLEAEEVDVDAMDVAEEELVVDEVVELEEIEVGVLEVLVEVVEPTIETLSRDCIFSEPK